MGKVISIKKSPSKKIFGEIIMSIPEAAVVIGAILAVALAQFVFVFYGTFALLGASVGCTVIGVAWGLWLRRRRRTEDWTPPLINAGCAATSSVVREDATVRDAA